MVNIKKLRARMVESGISPSDAANALGISASTFYRKLQNPEKGLTVGDMRTLSELLRLTAEDATAIFFTHDVA